MGRMVSSDENQICSEQEFAHGRNLLTEFARSIEKLLTMKNLAGSDGSTRWLNVSHQANRSTAGAHRSTVSVVTAGTCWAGPSRRVLPVVAAKEYISYAHVAMEIIRLSSTNGVSYQVCCSTHNKFQKLTGWCDRDWAGVLENQWKKWETKIPCFLRPTRVTGALHDGPTQLHYCDENVDVISLHSNRIPWRRRR